MKTPDKEEEIAARSNFLELDDDEDDATMWQKHPNLHAVAIVVAADRRRQARTESDEESTSVQETFVLSETMSSSGSSSSLDVENFQQDLSEKFEESEMTGNTLVPATSVWVEPKCAHSEPVLQLHQESTRPTDLESIQLIDGSIVVLEEEAETFSCQLQDSGTIVASAIPMPVLATSRTQQDRGNKPHEDTQKGSCTVFSKKLDWQSILMILLAIAALTVCTLYLLTRKNKSNENLSLQSDSGSEIEALWDPEERLNEIITFLTEQRVAEASVFVTNNSPQAQAAEWLANEDRVLVRGIQEPNFLQRYALIAFAYSTSGDTLWKILNPWTLQGNTHECDFDGVTCFEEDDDDDKLEVSKLDLLDFQIPGTIPDEIGLLTSLTSLLLDRNRLDGSIPSTLFQLTNLEEFSVWSNGGFTKTLSPDFGNLSNLRLLALGQNYFTGTFPVEAFRKMTNMRDFDLGVLDMKGDILGVLDSWPKLQSFAYIPQFLQTGNDDKAAMTIPSTIGNLSDLAYLILYGIQATVPTEIGKLTKLEKLYLTEGGIGGEPVSDPSQTSILPTEIGYLTNLIDLSVTGTGFQGSLPTELGLMTQLEFLSFSPTGIWGIIPTELGLLTSLVYLYLADNEQLMGTIPDQVGALATSLETFDVFGTDLEGTIPIEFCSSRSRTLVTFDCVSVECYCCIDVFCL